jgi:hypothetical protein
MRVAGVRIAQRQTHLGKVEPTAVCFSLLQMTERDLAHLTTVTRRISARADDQVFGHGGERWHSEAFSATNAPFLGIR